MNLGSIDPLLLLASLMVAATPILQDLGYDIRPLSLGYSALVAEGFEQAE